MKISCILASLVAVYPSLKLEHRKYSASVSAFISPQETVTSNHVDDSDRKWFLQMRSKPARSGALLLIRGTSQQRIRKVKEEPVVDMLTFNCWESS